MLKQAKRKCLPWCTSLQYSHFPVSLLTLKEPKPFFLHCRNAGVMVIRPPIFPSGFPPPLPSRRLKWFINDFQLVSHSKISSRPGSIQRWIPAWDCLHDVEVQRTFLQSLMEPLWLISPFESLWYIGISLKCPQPGHSTGGLSIMAIRV